MQPHPFEQELLQPQPPLLPPQIQLNKRIQIMMLQELLLSHPQPKPFPPNPLLPPQQHKRRMIQMQELLPPKFPKPHPLSQPQPHDDADKSLIKQPPNNIYT